MGGDDYMVTAQRRADRTADQDEVKRSCYWGGDDYMVTTRRQACRPGRREAKLCLGDGTTTCRHACKTRKEADEVAFG